MAKKRKRINGAPRPMAHLCNPPSCVRITLRLKCSRCFSEADVRPLIERINESAHGGRIVVP
jgi:ribosomal protein L44E